MRRGTFKMTLKRFILLDLTQKSHTLSQRLINNKHLSFYYLSNYIVSHGKVALGCGVGVIQFKTRFPYGHHRHEMEFWRKKKM